MKLSQEVKRGLFLSLFLTIWLRVVVFLLGIYLLQSGLSSYVQNQAMNFAVLIPQEDTVWYSFIQPLHRFDALWYEVISMDWYSTISQSAAFFPLYPFLVSLLGQFTGLGFAQSAFVLNTVLSFLFFFLFYLLTLREYDAKTADQALFLYSIFPVVFFLLAPYAEVLLLVLTLSAFLFASYKKYFLVVIFASLATVTKPFAVALSVPLAVMLFREKEISHKYVKLAIFSIVPLIFMAVVAYQDSITGVTLSTIKAQKYWGIRFAWPWEMITAEWKFIAARQYNLPNHINVLLVVVGLFFLYAMKVKMKLQYFLYTLILYLVFFLASFKEQAIPFFSFSRFFLTLFPIFMLAGTIKLHSILKLLYCIISFVFLIYLFILYSSGIFVA